MENDGAPRLKPRSPDNAPLGRTSRTRGPTCPAPNLFWCEVHPRTSPWFSWYWDREKFKKNFIDRLISFSISIIELTDSFPDEPKFWPIRDQFIRCATSIGANVVEAKSSSSRKDYIKFFEIALKSANETGYWLLVLKRLGLGCDSLLRENKEIASVIASSLLTLKNKR